jgi:tRNA nucleotidyltransferase (CCA-adding enzyme)
MMVLDECARRRNDVKNPLGFMLSAICHDMGKATCTEVVNGEIHSYNHEIEGLPIAETFICRFTNDKKLIKYVLNMVEYHMKPNTLAAMGSAIKKTNKMFDQAVEPLDLIHLAVADSLGKVAPREYYETEPFLMERLALFEEHMKKPYVTGDDLIAAGFEPGEQFAKMLEYAHKLRLAGFEKETALKQTISFGRKLK